MRRLIMLAAVALSATALVGCDKTPPSAVTGVAARGAACTQVELAWTTSSDTGGSGLRGYNLYRDDVFVRTANATNAATMKANDVALSPSSSHTYDIEAVDNAGNKAAKVSISASTPLCAGANLPPTIAAQSDRNVLSQSALVLGAGDVSDPDGTIAEYEFDWGDNTPSTVVTAPTKTASHAWQRSGPYTVTISARDDGGAVASTSVHVTVDNRPPVAAFTAPATATADDDVTFDASASADPDGDIVSYEWNFGESSATGKVATYNYNFAQPYTVTLRVTDNFGRTGTVSKSITITPGNQAPVAQLQVSANAPSLTPVAFDGSQSTDDGTITAYRWDFDGDDAIDLTSAVATASHTYARSGSYHPSLTVVDDKNVASVPRVVSLNIQNRAPAARDFGPETVTVGTPAPFDASSSFDLDGDIVEYTWTGVGAGFSVTSANPHASLTFPATGGYELKLQVKDNLGALSYTSLPVVVINGPAPVADAGPDRTAAAGTAVTFTGTGSDSQGPAWGYAWDFGDNSAPAAGQTLAHTYAAPGRYDVVLRTHNPGGYDQTDHLVITVT